MEAKMSSGKITAPPNKEAAAAKPTPAQKSSPEKPASTKAAVSPKSASAPKTAAKKPARANKESSPKKPDEGIYAGPPAILFRIELENIRPKIWRKFFVPSFISLATFHRIIQDVMGWDDDHLYFFKISNKFFYFDGHSDSKAPYDDDTFRPEDYRLDDLYLDKGDVFRYVYDMGDNWKHLIKVSNPNFVPPSNFPNGVGCLKGEMACPPEDIGGVGGYYDLLNALDDPSDDEDREEGIQDWYSDYDCKKFDLDELNNKLSGYCLTDRRRRRSKK
jgi:hypothetical protein